MKRFLTFVVLVFLAMVISGFYGYWHDQISFTVSSEYFTKFKFHQFGLADSSMPDRMRAGIVGFGGTWWMGIPIGLIVGSFGFLHKSPRLMFQKTLKAYLVVAGVALLVGLGGLSYGWYFASENPDDYQGWFIPKDLEYPDTYFAVGHMHNFSYLGGLIGLVVGSWFQFRTRAKTLD